jgi:hypothetical protein
MAKAPFAKKGSGFSKAVYHIFFQNANVCSNFLKIILAENPAVMRESGLSPVFAERGAVFASKEKPLRRFPAARQKGRLSPGAGSAALYS